MISNKAQTVTVYFIDLNMQLMDIDKVAKDSAEWL